MGSMTKFTVRLPINGYLTFEVEANTESEAVSAALMYDRNLGNPDAPKVVGKGMSYGIDADAANVQPQQAETPA